MIPELRGAFPWFVMAAISFLHDEVLEDPDGPLSFKSFEWGSGGSTLWLSQRTASVVSVEHDLSWYDQCKRELAKYGIGNVETVLVPGDGYASYISRYQPGTFDLVLVDGEDRVGCVQNAVPILKAGGVLVLDDSSREENRTAGQFLAEWERRDFVSESGDYAGKTTTVWRKPE